MNSVILYTGEKGVGKSTYLQELFLLKPNVCGILQPRIKGIKFLVDIESAEKRRLELDSNSPMENVITIGDYLFSRDTFLWGTQKLTEAIMRANGLLIIDELGPLELSGAGLEPLLSEIITKSIVQKKNLLLVVRPTLIQQVIAIYGLPSPLIVWYGEKIPVESAC
ncbi:MAG: hypothetical protein COW85_05950 [Ignavibacteria bacterium CG22_combo_CG10-13_8_21_14_all_37_15]|nr:MAG: hypothetical protein COW85_05950 [Ignavibacteria bacterium CG22_combo_CG10-13_8_21_14_all_37_15]